MQTKKFYSVFFHPNWPIAIPNTPIINAKIKQSGTQQLLYFFFCSAVHLPKVIKPLAYYDNFIIVTVVIFILIRIIAIIKLLPTEETYICPEHHMQNKCNFHRMECDKSLYNIIWSGGLDFCPQIQLLFSPYSLMNQ